MEDTGRAVKKHLKSGIKTEEYGTVLREMVHQERKHSFQKFKKDYVQTPFFYMKMQAIIKKLSKN